LRQALWYHPAMHRKTDVPKVSVRASAAFRAPTSASTSASVSTGALTSVHGHTSVHASADAHTSVCARTSAGVAASGEGAEALSAWLARYMPVERKIMEEHERRLAARARRAAVRREAAERRAEAARAYGDLCDATEGFAAVWRREGWSARDMVRWADGDALTLSALARWLRADATRRIDRAQCRLRRPLHYARERARREALAAERRRVCARRTTNPCPTREDILDAWVRRRESHDAAVRFGSMVHDLECYVDNSLLRDGSGAIVGRRGGVKAWLQTNIPALYVRYTTVMRYKAMAKKLRQVTGLSDPVPAAAVLGTPPPEEDAARKAGDATEKGASAERLKRDYGAYEIAGREDAVRTDGNAAGRNAAGRNAAGRNAAGRNGGMAAPGLDVVRARAVWLEVVKDIRGSATALMERLDALTDPERADDANMLAEWRAKYENEITVRMKSRWWRRLMKAGNGGV